MLFAFNLNATRPTTPLLDPTDLSRVLGATSPRFLGRGGFGESWSVAMANGPTLAVKILLNPAQTSQRVAREVTGLTRVSSPHVVRLVDVNVLDLAIGQRLALIFEFIDGGDIWTRVQAAQWPTDDETRAFVTGVLRALAALHQGEVVHRDVKPENLMLRGGDWASPVLLDLGLGRLLDEPSLTAYPAAVGTAPYMAPEVIQGRRARKGSDLWSLGVIAHLLLTHSHPFYPDPLEILDEDEAYKRMAGGAPPLPVSVGDPLAAVVPRLVSVASFERGSASRALSEMEL